MEETRKLPFEQLHRKRQVVETRKPKPPPSVSAGAIPDKLSELAFNPTREKLREVTIINRVQGRLFPMLDMINTGLRYILEIAMYRQDAEEYERQFDQKRPIPPDLLDEFLFRTAQWQKSVAGKNLEKATDIALADIENRVSPFEELRSGDAWKET